MSPTMIWLTIVFLPLALGIVLRVLLRRWRRAWCLSAALAVLTALAWITALYPPIPGSELYGLRTIQALSMTAGSAITGMILRARRGA